MDETVRMERAGLSRFQLAPRIERAARGMGVILPLAIVAGPSFADIAASGLALLFLLHAGLTGRWAWLREPWLVAGLALWGYLSLRSAFADHTAAALAAAVPFLRFVIFAAALQGLVLSDLPTRRRLVYAACFALGLLALDALLQFAAGFDMLGRPRMFGFRLTAFYEHAWVGAVIAWLFLPVVLSLLDRGRKRLALGLGALWLCVIVLSGDRMALICALAQLALLGLCTRKSRRMMLIGVPLLALGIAGLFLAAPAVYERQVSSTIETIKNLPNTQYGAIWTSAWKVARAHPLFGVGAKGFEAHCPDPQYGALYPPNWLLPRCASHPHNTYLEWLADGGLVGFFLFVLTMGYVVAALLPLMRAENRDWAGRGLFVTLIARLWPLASWTSFHHAWSAVPFWLVVGWGLALAKPPR